MKTLLFSLTRKDFRIEYFKGSGAGGQNRNKRMTACRVVHPASGAVSECQEEREAHQNFKRAFERLHQKPAFKRWLSEEVRRIDTGKTALERAEEALRTGPVRTEVRGPSGWVEVDPGVLCDGDEPNDGD